MIPGKGPYWAAWGDRLVVLLARARMSPAQVRLTLSSALGSPIALVSHEIIVPPRALELEPRQQEAMLAHELAHVVRRDPAWLVLAAIIEAALFIQPLNRLARRGMQEAAEELSDDWAVRHLGSGLHLARCLAEVAGWLEHDHASEPFASPMASERGSILVRRVRRLLDDAGPRRALATRSRVMLAAGMLIAAIWGAPGFAPIAGAAPGAAVPPAVPAAPVAPVAPVTPALPAPPAPHAPPAPPVLASAASPVMAHHDEARRGSAVKSTMKQRRLTRRADRPGRKAAKAAREAVEAHDHTGEPLFEGMVFVPSTTLVSTDGRVLYRGPAMARPPRDAQPLRVAEIDRIVHEAQRARDSMPGREDIERRREDGRERGPDHREVERMEDATRDVEGELQHLEEAARDLQEQVKTLEATHARRGIEAQLREVERQLQRMRAPGEEARPGKSGDKRKPGKPGADARNI